MSHELAVVAFLCFELPFTALRIAYHPRPDQDRDQRVSHHEPAWQLWIMGMLLTAMVLTNVLWILTPALLAPLDLPVPATVRLLGTALGLASVALLWWTHHTLGANYDPLLHTDPELQLVTTGPYARVRHPMYTALLGVAVATALTTANLGPGLSWIGGIGFVVYRRLGPEEALLERRFGERYRAWARRTGRLLPKVLF
jgi:protein-S-isoprenylcysteine O-methyltransferase Ste14